MANDTLPRVPLLEDGRPVDPIRLRRFIDLVTNKINSKQIYQSPLTTKGDLFTFSTQDDRLPVGLDGQVLVANAGTPTGLEWRTTFAPPGFGPFTPPIGSFTNWDNQGPSTIDTTTGLVYFSTPGAVMVGDDWRFRYDPCASTFTLTGVFAADASANNTGFAAGLMVRDSSTDRRLFYGVNLASFTHDPVLAANYSDATTFHSTWLNNVIARWRSRTLIMMRIRRTATHWFLESSMDFQHWILDYREPNGTAYVANPDQAGYAINFYTVHGFLTDASGAMLVYHMALS